MPWAMQIVVEDTKDFTALQLSSALAKAVLHYLDEHDSDAVARWMEGRFRKLLRRAKNSAWAKVQVEEGQSYSFDGVNIFIATPAPVDAVPVSIKKAQVSGFTVKDAEGPAFDLDTSGSYANVYLNGALSMTAPKAAVAAAHAAQIMAGTLADQDYARWKEAGFPLSVFEISEIIDDFSDSQRIAVVRDAGLTEVLPGSITATCNWL